MRTRIKIGVTKAKLNIFVKILNALNNVSGDKMTVEDVERICNTGVVYAECNNGKTKLKSYTIKEIEDMVLDGTI